MKFVRTSYTAGHLLPGTGVFKHLTTLLCLTCISSPALMTENAPRRGALTTAALRVWSGKGTCV